MRSNSKQKYLFLDIDGVLNHEDWFLNARSQGLRSPHFWFDPECVERVNRILEETKATLVISSSWRSDPKLSEQFAEVGLPTSFNSTIGMGHSWKLGYTIRGEEIDHYLREHDIDVHSKHRYVILDDDNDFTPWQKKNTLFRTAASVLDEPYMKNNGSGLTDELTERIIKYLSYESKRH